MLKRPRTPAVGRKIRVGRVREMVEGSSEETMGNVQLEDVLISEFSLGGNESPDQYNTHP